MERIDLLLTGLDNLQSQLNFLRNHIISLGYQIGHPACKISDTAERVNNAVDQADESASSFDSGAGTMPVLDDIPEAPEENVGPAVEDAERMTGTPRSPRTPSPVRNHRGSFCTI